MTQPPETGVRKSQPKYVPILTPEMVAGDERRAAAETPAQRRLRERGYDQWMPDTVWAKTRAAAVVGEVEVLGFTEWNRRQTRKERGSETHREIDTFLGLTKHRHRGSWPTFYTAQVGGYTSPRVRGQLEMLLILARREAYADWRYLILTYCETCNLFVELRGARRAYAFLARHGRHVTWLRGIPVRQRSRKRMR